MKGYHELYMNIPWQKNYVIFFICVLVFDFMYQSPNFWMEYGWPEGSSVRQDIAKADPAPAHRARAPLFEHF